MHVNDIENLPKNNSSMTTLPLKVAPAGQDATLITSGSLKISISHGKTRAFLMSNPRRRSEGIFQRSSIASENLFDKSLPKQRGRR
jgi:hypothetical protein